MRVRRIRRFRRANVLAIQQRRHGMPTVPFKGCRRRVIAADNDYVRLERHQARQ